MAQQINLYDSQLEKKRDWLALTNVVAAAAALLVIIIITGVVARLDLPELAAKAEASDIQVKALRDQVSAMGQQIAAIKPDPVLEKEVEYTRVLADMRGEVLSVLKQRLGPNAVSYAEYLRGFARQTFAGLWLTGFVYDAGTDGMEISGRTTDPALLPQYIQRLNREPVFQGRAFASLNLTAGEVALPVGTATPAASVTPATATGSSAATLPKKAPYHEFKLVPVKTGDAESGGKSTATTGGKG